MHFPAITLCVCTSIHVTRWCWCELDLTIFVAWALRRRERPTQGKGMSLFKNIAIIALHGHPNQQINANCSICPKCQIINGAFCFFLLCISGPACVRVRACGTYWLFLCQKEIYWKICITVHYNSDLCGGIKRTYF